jgi:hypothetical protein
MRSIKHRPAQGHQELTGSTRRADSLQSPRAMAAKQSSPSSSRLLPASSWVDWSRLRIYISCRASTGRRLRHWGRPARVGRRRDRVKKGKRRSVAAGRPQQQLPCSFFNGAAWCGWRSVRDRRQEEVKHGGRGETTSTRVGPDLKRVRVCWWLAGGVRCAVRAI